MANYKHRPCRLEENQRTNLKKVEERILLSKLLTAISFVACVNFEARWSWSIEHRWVSIQPEFEACERNKPAEDSK